MKLLFLILIVIIFILNEKRTLVEPVILSCCGGMNMHQGDYKESDPDPPKKWKRCFKPNTWESMPCTSAESDKCCGGEGKCRPTRYGGKCELDDRSSGRKFFIYDDDGNKKDYGPDEENEDRETYQDEDEEGDRESFKRDEDLSTMFYTFCFIFMFVLLAVLAYFFISGNSNSNSVKSPVKQEKYYGKYI